MCRGEKWEDAGRVCERFLRCLTARAKLGAHRSAPRFWICVGVVQLSTPDAVIKIVFLPILRRVQRGISIGASPTLLAGPFTSLEGKRLHQIKTGRSAETPG